MGPDETGGGTEVGTSKVVGAAEIIEGLVIRSGVVPTEETEVSLKSVPGEARI